MSKHHKLNQKQLKLIGDYVMKKRIISALMAMCVSAFPMSVCAENSTDNAEIELLEFTQKFYDEVLLNPEESEDNRLIYNYFKGVHDYDVAYNAQYGRIYSDDFFGVEKDEKAADYGSNFYYVKYTVANCTTNNTVPGHDDIKIAQYIDWGNWACELDYRNNPYITEEEFEELNYEEKYLAVAKIYDETGDRIAYPPTTMVAREPYYVGENGKGYNYEGKELDIVDGEIVEIPDITVDNVDILETEKVTGDANVDGDVNMADAVLIMQSLSNPNEYKLSEQGLINADYNDDGGVTALDALEIQILMIS